MPPKRQAVKLSDYRSFAAMKLDKYSGKEDFEDRPFVLITNGAGFPTLWMRFQSIYETETSPNEIHRTNAEEGGRRNHQPGIGPGSFGPFPGVG
ncbi:unnamed protein product [Caenorhabditis nigoni]